MNQSRKQELRRRWLWRKGSVVKYGSMLYQCQHYKCKARRIRHSNEHGTWCEEHFADHPICKDPGCRHELSPVLGQIKKNDPIGILVCRDCWQLQGDHRYGGGYSMLAEAVVKGTSTMAHGEAGENLRKEVFAGALKAGLKPSPLPVGNYVKRTG